MNEKRCVCACVYAAIDLTISSSIVARLPSVGSFVEFLFFFFERLIRPACSTLFK